MKGIRFLSEAERFPMLSPDGRKLLRWMHEHPNAPHYNYSCGDQLTRDGLHRVRAYEAELRASTHLWSPGEVPEWTVKFAERCLRDVPYYRRKGGRVEDFQSLPTCSRQDLEREQWSFVPDGQSLEEMIIYYTSGTTGKPFHIPSHAEVSSKYLAKLKVRLEKIGITLEGGKGRVTIINPCAQKDSLTYATISSYLGEAGYVKVNLKPSEWRREDDPVKFIDDCDPEIFTGDPIAFLALAKLPLKTRPKALVSSAMTLLPALQRDLEAHFNCPVIDVYSMNETRFIAARKDAHHELVPHDLFVEILDGEGNPTPVGVRGEITVTCGRNPYFALLRYRTGDYAALDFTSGRPTLVGFSGRPPVLFVDSQGQIINNIDVTHELETIPMGQYSLHQNADRSLVFKVRGGNIDTRRIKATLQSLFGSDLRLTIQELHEEETQAGKILTYSTDVETLITFT